VRPRLPANEGARMAVVLGGFALIAAAVLGTAHELTEGPIQRRERAELRRTLNRVVPPTAYDNTLVRATRVVRTARGDAVRVYRGTRDGAVTAVAFQVLAPGYNGPIRLLMGLERHGRVLGVRVLDHQETPGLGDRIEARKSDWILDFTGRSLGNPLRGQWTVEKDGGVFDQFTGATITPRGVVAGVRRGLLFFRRHRAALLDPAAGGDAATDAPALDATDEGESG